MTPTFAAARFRTLVGSSLLAVFFVLAGLPAASATPSLVVDVATGQVLEAQDATAPWYPASLTKLMSVYVTFQALQAGRVTLDTPFIVSARAARMPPSKMGFAPGTEVTLDNLLKMMLVKSANDLAITLSEGVSGSVEAFAVQMNADAVKLGLHESHFANPNGLQDPNHYSSARDLAIVARALLLEFPQYSDYFDIGSFQLGKEVVTTTNNGLLGHYPGVDGMKTGFTCNAGFNIVATSVRGGRKLMVVVMGSRNTRARTLEAATLFDAGFSGNLPPLGDLNSLPKVAGGPTNMRDIICGGRRGPADDNILPASIIAASAAPSNPLQDLFMHATGQQPQPQPPAASEMSSVHPVYQPIPVYLGPTPNWNGPVFGPIGLAKADADGPPAGDALPTVSAYAPDATLSVDAPGSPVAPDPNALPLDLSGAARRHSPSVGEAATKAIALVAKVPVKAKVIAARAPVARGKKIKPKSAD